MWTALLVSLICLVSAVISFQNSQREGEDFIPWVARGLAWQAWPSHPVQLAGFVFILSFLTLLPAWGFTIWGKTDGNVVVAILSIIFYYYGIRYFSIKSSSQSVDVNSEHDGPVQI